MSATSPAPKRILVIDDDPCLLKLVSTLLETKGYHVETTSDAPAGLESAIKKTPDLLVLDVMMPMINGFNICRLLKSREAQKNIPIILLTSRVSEADRRIGMEVGADAYYCKPLDTEAFLAKVAELLK